MKKLIYKSDNYYISDDTRSSKGKTRKLTYKATISNMPHKHFSNYIVIYGRHTCPYCIKAIELLKNKPKTLFVEIDTEPHELFDKQNLLNILKLGNHDTIPIIYDKGVFIGGSTDAEEHFTI